MQKIKVTDKAIRLVINTTNVRDDVELDIVAVATDAFIAWAESRGVVDYEAHMEIDNQQSDNMQLQFHMHFGEDQDAVLFRLDWPH